MGGWGKTKRNWGELDDPPETGKEREKDFRKKEDWEVEMSVVFHSFLSLFSILSAVSKQQEEQIFCACVDPFVYVNKHFFIGEKLEEANRVLKRWQPRTGRR